jgi:hypothetical protein
MGCGQQVNQGSQEGVAVNKSTIAAKNKSRAIWSNQ